MTKRQNSSEANENGSDFKVLPPVTRSSAGLRTSLFDELDMLRAGETTPAKANAVARISDQIISSVNLELEVQRFVRTLPPNKPLEDFTPKAIPFND